LHRTTVAVHSTLDPSPGILIRKAETVQTPTSSAVKLEFQGPIAIMTVDQPGSRANTLGQAVLSDLEVAVAQLASRTDLRGLVLRSGKPGMFIAGADLKELGAARPEHDPIRKMLKRGLDLMTAFEGLPYPTVAIIDGACMGGGLELAMSFDYRLASTNPKTELGLPEVKVGLIPGWGGTQRLSRLIGPSLAAEMICGGDPAKAERAVQLGLIFDVVQAEKLVETALGLLEWANASGEWKKGRQKKKQPVGLSQEQLGFAMAVVKAQVQAKSGGHYPAPLAAVDAIARGCNVTLEEGLKAETEAFLPLIGSPTSRNLISVFFLTGRLQKDTGVADPKVEPRPVNLAGVVGAGIMGSGIAGALVRRGIPTMMLDSAPAAVEKGVGAITRVIQSRIEIGRATPADMVNALARLSTSLTPSALADRDVVIEAIVENEPAKVKLFGELQKIVPPAAILASNTSTISITRMAQSVANPANFAGMHFFNPVDRMQLVEVIRGAKTSDQTIVTLVALAKKIGKTPIVVRDCPGFLVNRILFPYMNEAMLMLEEGASPRDIDKAATVFGMPMGPITLNDVVGIDTSHYAGQVIATAFPDRVKHPRILGELVAAGRLGQKTGAGFFSYAKGTRGVDDPALETVLAKCRTGRRSVGMEEITDRLFLPMVTEASRVLMEGIVRDPGEVDMGLILGIGFPPFRGGLLRWADSLGMPAVLAKLEKYATLGTRFHPTEQMRQLAAAGKGSYRE
jgi:3-hydroxyacyl-CoA dehydrogenase/enoyl-CoA hydratase/3-hydroxybutyryl-CoA epimerase/3-hydroxyacyl-CoA dehydrogenase/enoyl-CoA hydratase/3-hydroxybutyryl-CoA epimerase/enoyl-CoA isomerase